MTRKERYYGLLSYDDVESCQRTTDAEGNDCMSYQFTPGPVGLSGFNFEGLAPHQMEALLRSLAAQAMHEPAEIAAWHLRLRQTRPHNSPAALRSQCPRSTPLQTEQEQAEAMHTELGTSTAAVTES